MSFLTSIFNKKHETPVPDESTDLILSAPVDGTAVPIEEVPDPVISEKVAGDGIAVIPEGAKIVAPCDGIISRMLVSSSAFAIKSDTTGLEIYVSYGIGTSAFTGEGFKALKQPGDRAVRGEAVIELDLAARSEKLKSTAVSMIVIRSSGDISKVSSSRGRLEAGKTPCVWINLNQEKQKAASASAAAPKNTTPASSP